MPAPLSSSEAACKSSFSGFGISVPSFFLRSGTISSIEDRFVPFPASTRLTGVPHTRQNVSFPDSSDPQNLQYSLFGSCLNKSLLTAPQTGQYPASGSIISPQYLQATLLSINTSNKNSKRQSNTCFDVYCVGFTPHPAACSHCKSVRILAERYSQRQIAFDDILGRIYGTYFNRNVIYSQ